MQTRKSVMHDPFAMRPFMGYNFGQYLEHWVNLQKGNHQVPKIFHVNWFRKSKDGKFLWPGFGENIRVIDWIIRRLDGEEGIGQETAIGVIPTRESMNMEGLGEIDWDQLMSLPPTYWHEDSKEVRKFIEEQLHSEFNAEHDGAGPFRFNDGLSRCKVAKKVKNRAWPNPAGYPHVVKWLGKTFHKLSGRKWTCRKKESKLCNF